MYLWKTRKKAKRILSTEYAAQAKVLNSIFNIIDQCVDLHNENAPQDPYNRVCGLAIVKGRNISLGMYGMVLDNVSQEAGALLRVLIEYIELLVYVRTIPGAVEEAIENKLPSAGKIAKLIEGGFKETRESLNSNSSHCSFSPVAMEYLVDYKNSIIKVEHSFNDKVLFENLRQLFIYLMIFAKAAVASLESKARGCAARQEAKLIELLQIGNDLFRLDECFQKTKA